MSVITNMVLVVGISDKETVGQVNAWCALHDVREQQFAPLDESAAGGVKVFTGEVWAMAGNFFPWQELAAALGSFGWLDPDRVVLVVDHEHEERMAVFWPTDRVAGQ